MASKPSIMIMISNEKEKNILEMAFNQRNFDVVIESANHNTYIKALQFLPDIIFIQFDNSNGIEQERFTKAIFANKKGSNIAMIGYVSQHSHFSKEILNGIGITNVFIKPLKFSSLLKNIAAILKSKGKSIESEEKVTDVEADLKLVLNSNTNPNEKLDIMVNQISKLYAFPFSVAQIIKLTKDPNSSAKDLAKVIESDTVIATNILKLSNSVIYATRGGKVTSIKDAIIKVGFNETKKIASAMAIMELFDSDSDTMGYNGMEFWMFTISTSVICELFAKSVGIDENDIYITALLHGFGIIQYNQYAPSILSVLLNENLEQYYYYPKTEKEIIGIDNFQLSAELFDRWELPKSIGKALREIKLFSEFPDVLNSTHENVAYILSIARIVSKFLAVGRDCDSYVQILEKQVFDKLKMKMGITDGFIHKIHKNIFELLTAFKLDTDMLEKIPEKPTKNRVGMYNLSNLPFLGIDRYLQVQGYSVDIVVKMEHKKDFMDEVSVIIATEENSANDVQTIISTLTEKYSSAHLKKIILFAPKENTIYNQFKSSDTIVLDFHFDIRVFEDTVDKILNNATDKILTPPEEVKYNVEEVYNKIKKKVGIAIDDPKAEATA